MEKIKNKKEIWFRAKYYGWGWYPCTWQGWTIMLIWAIAFVGNFILVDKRVHSISDFLYGIFVFNFVITLILIAICLLKGEKPRWRWGK